MATLTNQEIEQLQQQLKQKTQEVKEIYDKLVEAGAVPVPDDFLDTVSGGICPFPTHSFILTDHTPPTKTYDCRPC